MCGGGSGECVTGLQRFGYPDERLFEGLVGCLLCDDLKSIENRNPSLYEDGKLARKVHQVLAMNLALGDLKLKEALLFLQADCLDTTTSQTLVGRSHRRSDLYPGSRRSVSCDRC